MDEDIFFEEEDFDEEIDKDEPCTCDQEPRETYKRSNFFFTEFYIEIIKHKFNFTGDSTSSNYKKTNAHPGVTKLHFTGNPVSEWLEICRLGRVFPNLEALVLAECPLK